MPTARSRPYVILSAAMSIDGKIATRTGASRLSSKRDLARVHRLRGSADAILVGRNTVAQDDPMLTVRLARGKNPTRIVLDPRAAMPPSSRIGATANSIPTIVAVTETAPKSRAERLAKRGLEVIVCGRSRIDLGKLLSILARKGIRKLVVEGGGTTNWHFLAEDLADEILVTIAPFVVGGTDAVSLVGGRGFGKISHSFKLKQVERLGNEIVLRYVR